MIIFLLDNFPAQIEKIKSAKNASFKLFTATNPKINPSNIQMYYQRVNNTSMKAH